MEEVGAFQDFLKCGKSGVVFPWPAAGRDTSSFWGKDGLKRKGQFREPLSHRKRANCEVFIRMLPTSLPLSQKDTPRQR